MRRDIFLLLAAITVIFSLQFYATSISHMPPAGAASLMLWQQLKETKISIAPKTGQYFAAIPPAIQAMNGKPVTLSGYLVPIELAMETHHFLLSKRAPTCPFCPPGEPNEVVEVFSKQPMPWRDSFVTITGTMNLTDNPETGVFFQIKEGVIAPIQR